MLSRKIVKWREFDELHLEIKDRNELIEKRFRMQTTALNISMASAYLMYFSIR
jgi:hypothetical protein